MNAVASEAHLKHALQYGNHSSVTEHLPAICAKIGEDFRRQKFFVIQISAAHDIPNLGVSPLAAVVTHKVLIINYVSFDVQSREKKRGINGDTYPVPSPNACAPKRCPSS